MASINVTPELMRSTAKKIDSSIIEWNESVKKIFGLVEEMDAMWDGLGNDSFNIIFKQEEPKFNNLNILMADYTKMVAEAANRYDTGEQEVKTIVSRKR